MDISNIRRWNFEAKEDGVYVCKGEHEKHEGCTNELLSNEEIVKLLRVLAGERNVILESTKTKIPYEEGT